MSPASRSLSRLLQGAGIRPLEAPRPDPTVTGVEIDSRRIARGQVFCALRGANADGERFAADAIARGAAAIVAASSRPHETPAEIAWVRVEDPRRAAALLAREWFGRPDEALTLVGVTGTNGKTTVTYLLEAIARAAGVRPGRIGTTGRAFGGREDASPRTTPEAPEFYASLALMRNDGVGLAAAEISSHALALSRVAGARFAVAAFLNLGRDHLDFHGDPESYFEAKASLFDSLGPAQAAVLPADDARGDRLAQRTRGRVFRFGRSPAATVRVSGERCAIDGSTAAFEIGAARIPFRLRLPGRFNLDNAAAAAACAVAAGLPAEALPAGIEAVERVPGRMEAVQEGQPFAVLVDFAHTEDALRRLLAGVRELVSGRVLLVFGCGGDRDRGKRPAMGRAAAEGADQIFLASDNPRSEEPLRILREIEAGVLAVPGAGRRCRVISDRAEAVAAAVGSARQGDAVILAGKGHETTQTFGDHVNPLDDRVIAREALRALGWREGHRASA